MQNRIFFPQEALDTWMSDGSVELRGTELTILAEGRRYRLAEAVNILREVGGSDDSNELVGRVKSVKYLEELGAEIVETSVLLGDNAYDAVPGWLGAPVGSFDEHVAHRTGGFGDGPMDEPRTDEDLLARFLVKNL
jgi:hypothetical protein